MPTTTTTTPSRTVTQGSVGAGGGIVNYNPNTGVRLTPGQTVNINPGNSTYGANPIVNSKAATTNLNNIKNNVATINNGITTQGATVVNATATANAMKTAQAEKDAAAKVATDKAAADKKAQDLKTAALTGTMPEPPAVTPEQQTIDEAKKKKDALDLEYDNAFNQFKTATDGIINGSVPLNAGEQAQVNGLTAQYQALIAQQKLENTGSEGLGNIRGYQTGSAEYDPTFQAKIIGSIVTAGANKIADLNTKMASAVADLTQKFKDNDLKAIKDSWDEYKGYEKDKSDAIQKTIDDTTKAIQQNFDNAEKIKADDLAALIHNDTVSYQDKELALNRSQLSETKRHNLQDELVARENSMKGAYEVTPDGRIFNKNSGKFTDDVSTGAVPSGEVKPGHTGNPLLDNNTKTTISGIPYVDGTNLKGNTANAAQLQAAKLGIPYLGKDGADALSNVDTARTNMENITTSLDGILPSNWLTKFIVGPENKLSGYFQTSDQIASFNAYRSAAIQALRAMAGSKGLRINQAEILQSVNQDIPKVTDTVGTAKAKIDKVNSMLDSQEKGLIGKDQYNKFTNPDISSTSPKITAAKNAGYSNDDIVTKLKTDPVIGSKVQTALQQGYTSQQIIDYFQ